MLKKKGDGEHCELKSAQRLLLSLQSLDGKTITSDPLHNQCRSAQITAEKGSESIQQVKGNQKKLLALIVQAFTDVLPVYGAPEKSHGRIERRAIAVLGTSAMKTSFPHARSIMAVWSRRTEKGKTSETVRYFISSIAPQERTHAQWLRLIRGHWGGVENRNHWRKDAVWGEDGTRSRNPNIAGNLALLRNALLRIVDEHSEHYESLPAFTEAMQAHPSQTFKLITRGLRG